MPITTTIMSPCSGQLRLRDCEFAERFGLGRVWHIAAQLAFRSCSIEMVQPYHGPAARSEPMADAEIENEEANDEPASNL